MADSVVNDLAASNLPQQLSEVSLDEQKETSSEGHVNKSGNSNQTPKLENSNHESSSAAEYSMDISAPVDDSTRAGSESSEEDIVGDLSSNPNRHIKPYRSGAFSFSISATGDVPRPWLISKKVNLKPDIQRAEALVLFEDYAKKNSTTFNRPEMDRFLVINEIKNFNRLYYTLESFVEERRMRMKRVPASKRDIGKKEDAPDSIETIFDVIALPAAEFTKEKQEYNLSWMVDKCNNCEGKGRVLCVSCGGNSSARVMGPYVSDPCGMAAGVNQSCMICTNGKQTCGDCKGSGALKYMDLLDVHFSVSEITKFEPGDLGIPDDELLKGESTCLFRQQGEKLPRMRKRKDFPDVAQISFSCLDLHHRLTNEHTRVIQQRQQVFSLPVTSVMSHYKGKQMTIYIYGKDKRVYCQQWSTCSFL